MISDFQKEIKFTIQRSETVKHLTKMEGRNLDDDLTDRGFDYVLRDKLKQHCMEKNLFLHCSGMNVQHDLIIDLITYSSMGDWNQALKSAEETNKFLKTFPPLMNALLWGSTLNQRKSRLMLEVWRNCFIRTKLALEHTGLGQANYDLHTIPQSFARRIMNIGSPVGLILFFDGKMHEWETNSFSVYNYMMEKKK